MDTARNQRGLVVRDPDIHGGEPVFAGTRVPVHTLLDYLEHGEGLEEFLENYPTVRRDQAEAALTLMREALQSA